MMKIALIFIGTGSYRKFFDGYYKAYTKYFLPDVEKDFFVFTDDIHDETFNVDNTHITEIEHEPWPFVTLNRFQYMLKVEDKLKEYDWILYTDSDLWPVQEIEENLLSGEDYIGVQHPGYLFNQGPFEDNKNSTAYSFGPDNDLKHYRQGCFWAAPTEKFLELIKTCYNNVETDKKNSIIAKWHDESHLNKFFSERQDVTTIHAGFACPQNHALTDLITANFPVMMIHLEKDMTEYPRFEGGTF
tara:strand:+ start:2788 stop:3519 length:732 start_codon:yes stop_codon:yes gene_type:complete